MQEEGKSSNLADRTTNVPSSPVTEDWEQPKPISHNTGF